MSNYMSRAEIEEISEGLIQLYATKHSGKVVHYIDIEHFITEFLSLKIEYAAFAEDDGGKIGFLADGETPLLIHQDGKISPFIFPKDTIVLDKLLLSEKNRVDEDLQWHTKRHIIYSARCMMYPVPVGFTQNMTMNAVIPEKNLLRCLLLLNGRQIQWELRCLCRNVLSKTHWQSITILSR